MLMTIYERIRQLRISAGMSQEDLAHAMGYKDRSMITKIESGKVDISQKKIVEFARILNTTPGYLMGWSDEPSMKRLNMDLQHFNDDCQPKNDDVRLLIRGLNQLSPEQLEQATNMMRIMFAKYADYFDKEKDNDA